VPVKLRLVRMGKKKQPTYRLVAADSRSPRDGRFLEVLGTYEPRGASRAAPETVLKVNNERAVQWLHQGAQPTERVEKLLRASGAWSAFKGTDDATAEAPAGAPPAGAPAAAAPEKPEPVESERAETETEPVSAEA
jgi:small subunit ribosomal protein S16